MDIFETLLKFRRFKIAFACDIQEMYLQIQINKDDRTYLRLLWRDKGLIKEYELQRLPFGLNVSPFLAQLVSRENAKLEGENMEKAALIIKSSTYMDDSMYSVDNLKEALDIDVKIYFWTDKRYVKKKRWKGKSVNNYQGWKKIYKKCNQSMPFRVY